jgi:hypothetical protein
MLLRAVVLPQCGEQPASHKVESIRSNPMNPDILVRVMAGALFLIVVAVIAFRRKKIA